MDKRAREVSHARVVGEEVRLLFSSSFAAHSLDFIFRSLSLALRSMPMKNKHAPSQSEMNTMATRDLVT